jgi:hypothetical protein
MKNVFGALMVLAGVLIGLYVGIWLMFVGGVFNIVEFAQGDFQEYAVLGWGIVKIMLAGFIGQICAMTFILPGMAILD